MSNNIHILVVDDNQINRQYFSMALKKFGYRVTIAESGFKALECAQTTQFDIIFMDIRMPVMDGNQTASKIRGINKNKDTPILAISAEHNSNDYGNLFNGFILKPVSPKQLKQNIEKYCGNESLDLKIFDQDNALKYAYDDKEILDKLIVMFLNEIPIQMEFLEQTIINENYSESQNIIHKLRGSCKTCGAASLDENLKILSTVMHQEKIQIEYAFNKVESSVDDFINIFI